jgi:hypothetical protein
MFLDPCSISDPILAPHKNYHFIEQAPVKSDVDLASVQQAKTFGNEMPYPAEHPAIHSRATT